MITNEIIGWIGSILFAICGLPQVIHTWRTRKTDDLNELFLWLWFWGEVLTFAYMIYGDYIQKTLHIPLYFNYFINILMVSYLIYAKYQYNTKDTALDKITHAVDSLKIKIRHLKRGA